MGDGRCMERAGRGGNGLRERRQRFEDMERERVGGWGLEGTALGKGRERLRGEYGNVLGDGGWRERVHFIQMFTYVFFGGVPSAIMTRVTL